MSSLKIANALERRKNKLLLLICYFPVSFCLIGILAYHMRCPSPVVGSYPFIDVFLFYANPLNLKFISVHFPSLLLSFALLLLMVISVNTSKPIITLLQIRTILLVLIAIITLLVHIFFRTLIPFTPMAVDARRDVLIPLFLYVNVDLILVFLLTFLPFFQKLKTRLL